MLHYYVQNKNWANNATKSLKICGSIVAMNSKKKKGSIVHSLK